MFGDLFCIIKAKDQLASVKFLPKNEISLEPKGEYSSDWHGYVIMIDLEILCDTNLILRS